jgi:hypothetical protein
MMAQPNTNKLRPFARVAALALVMGSLLFAVGYDANQAEGFVLSEPDREDSVEPFAGDVYVANGPILENPTFETSSDTQLFNVAGTPLGVTWGEWKGASSTSRARTVDRRSRTYTNVRVQMSGLVPEGVYSLFYATFEPDSRNPLCPGQERLLPLRSRDKDQSPDRSSFVAGTNGEATFYARVNGRLLDARRVVYAAIYHFDGLTYHPLPNRGEFVTQGDDCRSSFGADAMRQLIVVQKSGL